METNATAENAHIELRNALFAAATESVDWRSVVPEDDYPSWVGHLDDLSIYVTVGNGKRFAGFEWEIRMGFGDAVLAEGWEEHPDDAKAEATKAARKIVERLVRSNWELDYTAAVVRAVA